MMYYLVQLFFELGANFEMATTVGHATAWAGHLGSSGHQGETRDRNSIRVPFKRSVRLLHREAAQ